MKYDEEDKVQSAYLSMKEGSTDNRMEIGKDASAKVAAKMKKNVPGQSESIGEGCGSKSKKEAMDPVGKEDGDIDNDGDMDKSDKYLSKRRKAISKAMKESAGQALQKATALRKQTQAKVQMAATDAASEVSTPNPYGTKPSVDSMPVKTDDTMAKAQADSTRVADKVKALAGKRSNDKDQRDPFQKITQKEGKEQESSVLPGIISKYNLNGTSKTGQEKMDSSCDKFDVKGFKKATQEPRETLKEVASAAKKPENYKDPRSGKTKVRMVPVDKDVLDQNEATDPISTNGGRATQTMSGHSNVKGRTASGKASFSKDKGVKLGKGKGTRKGYNDHLNMSWNEAVDLDMIRSAAKRVKAKTQAQHKSAETTSDYLKRGGKITTVKPSMDPTKKKGRMYKPATGKETKNSESKPLLPGNHRMGKNEGVEQIAELSKQTLGSYVKKAVGRQNASRELSHSFSRDADVAKDPNSKSVNRDLAKTFKQKADKRKANINKAVDKLSK